MSEIINLNFLIIGMNIRKRLREYRNRFEPYPEEQFVLADSGCYFRSMSEFEGFCDKEDEY